MPTIIAISQQFDQPTLGQLIDADPVVQRYRTPFAPFDWTALEKASTSSGPGRPAHPPSAYVKALLVRIGEHLSSTPRWRAYLLDHPLWDPELGFRPHLDITAPYGFAVGKTVLTVRPPNPIRRPLVCTLLAGPFPPTLSTLLSQNPAQGAAETLCRPPF